MFDDEIAWMRYRHVSIFNCKPGTVARTDAGWPVQERLRAMPTHSTIKIEEYQALLVSKDHSSQLDYFSIFRNRKFVVRPPLSSSYVATKLSLTKQS